MRDARRPTLRNAARCTRCRNALRAIQAACLVLCSALMAGAGMARLVTAAEQAVRPHLGDLVRIAPGPEQAGSSRTVMASVASAPTLAPGAACAIGFGEAAAEGGSLILLRREADGAYIVAWAGPGRSVRTGPDCGRVADLRLTRRDIEDLRNDGAGDGSPAADGAMM